MGPGDLVDRLYGVRRAGRRLAPGRLEGARPSLFPRGTGGVID